MGIAEASSDSIIPGSVLPTGRLVVYCSIPEPSLVVIKYLTDPEAGLSEGGLEILVKTNSTRFPFGITVGTACLSRFGSGLFLVNSLFDEFAFSLFSSTKFPIPSSFKKDSFSSDNSLLVPGTLYSPLYALSYTPATPITNLI